MRASWRRWTAAATQFLRPACTSSREAFLWWKHLKRYFCTLRNARVHLEMGTVTEKLQLTGIKEFANSNTCCPGVEDQWQGRAPSDILTSESKQLNRGTTLMYMSVISCWMHSIDCGNAATTLKITQSSAKKERTLARFGLACSNFVETECLIVVQVILFKIKTFFMPRWMLSLSPRWKRVPWLQTSMQE